MRLLCDIAAEIYADWPNVYYAARPYLASMRFLRGLGDHDLHDDGRDIVRRFLFNASTWRGPTARRVKAELRAMLAGRAT